APRISTGRSPLRQGSDRSASARNGAREAAAAPDWPCHRPAARSPPLSAPSQPAHPRSSRRSGQPRPSASGARRGAAHRALPRRAGRSSSCRSIGREIDFETGQPHLDQPDQQQENDRRDIEPAERRDEAPDRAQRRLGRAIEEVEDHRHWPAIGVEDVERDQPARHRLDDDQPPIDIEDRDQHPDYRRNEQSHVSAIPQRSGARSLISGRGARKPPSLDRAGRSAHDPRPNRGRSSVGRARRSQCRGQGFDPPRLHQFVRNLRLKRCVAGLATQPGYAFAMKRQPNLVRRRNTFYFRARVPVALVVRVGRSELWRSLRTTDPGLARLRAWRLAARLEQLWVSVRRSVTQEQIDQLIREWLREQLAFDKVTRTDIAFAEGHEHPGESQSDAAARMLMQDAEDSLFEWRDTVARSDWQKAALEVNALLAGRGIQLPRDSDPYRLLCLGMCVALRQYHGIRI